MLRCRDLGFVVLGLKLGSESSGLGGGAMTYTNSKLQATDRWEKCERTNATCEPRYESLTVNKSPGKQ